MGWGLIYHREELWVKILPTKYGCGDDMVPSVTLKKGCSNLWKGICLAWPHVQENLIWRIANGRSIKFWAYKWAPQIDCLSHHALVALSDSELNKTVADFVLDDGNWDWQSLLVVLPRAICDYIAGLAPPRDLDILDSVAWRGSNDGDFSVKSAYSFISHSGRLPADPLFKLIWNCVGLEWIQVFLWQVAAGALPTNYFRFSRHVSDDPTCSRCDLLVQETSLHVLHDCPIALGFWNRMIDAETYPTFYTYSLRSWVHWNLELNNPIAGNSWPCVFASAVHYLWRIKNQENFQFITPSEDDIFSRFWLVFKSQNLYVDYVDRSNLTKTHRVIHIAWSCPQEGWIKANSDGSVAHNKKASCGGILRNY